MKKLRLWKKIKVPFLSLLFFVLMFYAGFGKIMIQIFLLISFHECCHILAAISYGYEIKSIIVYPFGLGMDLHDIEYRHSLEEMVIAMAGLLSFLGSKPLINFFHSCGILSSVNVSYLHQINQSILLFNALPVYPLDGGRILHGLMHLFFPYRLARTMTIAFSFGFLLVFCCFFWPGVSMFAVVIVFLMIQLLLEWRKRNSSAYGFYLYRYLHPPKYRIKQHSYQDLYRNYLNWIRQGKENIPEQTWLHRRLTHESFRRKPHRNQFF